MIIKGNILNIYTDEIYPGEIEIEKGVIQSIREVSSFFNEIIVPGFIDSHIHIESSKLTPSRFAEIALKHGTTSVVADPHEIANVMGLEGIEYMLNDARNSPLKFNFAAPSCVPTTEYETAGATIDSNVIDDLLRKDEFVSLGEVMDYNGVIEGKEDLIAKIESAKKHKKPIDGHAPLVTGEDLQKYVKYGIDTDHECTSKREAAEKRRMGVKIMIREGSESHMLEELLHSDADFIVSDDICAEDLIDGHIDKLLRKAVSLGMDAFEALKLVTINPAKHYNLNVGSITPGKQADLVFIDNLEDFNVKRVIVDGNTIYKKQKLLYRANPMPVKTTLKITPKTAEDFDVKAQDENHKSATVNVINVEDNTIISSHDTAKLSIDRNTVIPSVFEDILKISVIERYGGNTIANGFVHGFNIKNGAIASSVSHDSHNIIAVGTNSQYIAEATNKIIENKGGLVAMSNKEMIDLPLPIAGLMSDKSANVVSKVSSSLNELVSSMGCTLSSPYTTLSFLALPVVPSIKITNKGLFDVDANKFIDVIAHED